MAYNSSYNNNSYGSRNQNMNRNRQSIEKSYELKKQYPR